MKIIYLFSFFISFASFSQADYEKMLNRVSSEIQANVFLKRYSTEITGEVISISSTDALYKILNLNQAEKGDIIKNENTIYKFLSTSKGNSTSYRASIMEFDSKKTSISEINSLRSFILKGLKNKEHKFENLARVYSSHITAKTGGDLGWTSQGTFSKRFEKAIADKRVGEVFTFDEHRQNKHYIIFKTENNKALENITLLKFTNIK